MNYQKLVILCITSLLLLIPIAGATYDVVSGIASNSTEYTTTANYVELHNLSLATGNGVTFLKASWDARVNFTAPLYGRFLRDGLSLGRFNLTQSVYAQVGSYELAFNETTGTHYYGFEVYSNKRGTIYSRNFSAVFLKNGTYGTGAGGAGNVSSIICEPAGALDCSGTDEVTVTLNPQGTNFRNETIGTHTSQISTLQGNDTTDRVYVNDTFLPISTYSGNFPNTTIAGYNGNYPNTSLINYLLISTYGGNFPNSSLVNYLLISAYSGNFPNNTIANVVNCSALGSDYYTYNNGSAFLCRQDQTSSFSIRSNSEPLITGSARLIDGTGIVMTQVGSNITISSPAAGVTNASVNPQNMNASNLTSGTVSQTRLPTIPEVNLSLNYATHAQTHTLNGTDHTGNLNWSRLMNITMNLSATENLTGLLADAYISSATSWNGRLDAASGSGAIEVTESPANTIAISCKQVSGSQDGCLDSTNFTTFSGKLSNPATADLDMDDYNITGATNVSAKNIGGVIYAEQYVTLQDALNATPTGGSLYIPKGNYSSVNLNVSKYVRIYGDGIESNLSSYTDGSSVIIVSNHYSTIENIGITTGSNVTGITVDSFLLTLGVVDNRFKNIRFIGNGYSRNGMFYYGNDTHVPTIQYLESMYWGGYNTSLNVSKGYLTCVNCIFEESTTGLYTASGSWATLVSPWFETVTNATYSNCGGDITIVQPRFASVTNKYQENTSCGYRTNYHVLGGDENWMLPRWDNLSAQGNLEGSIGYNFTTKNLNVNDGVRWTTGNGTGAISFSNGSNNITVGTKKKIRQSTDGIITALYVNQTDDVACTGNITVTSSGTYKSHVNWSSAANASNIGLSATFTAGEWLLYNMTQNTGCTDFTFVQVHTKTS